MLDSTTKKRIDDCRDILVGKLPDPKSQIEQITIALIYKFMDDMDREAIELGGKARFFSGKFSKYAWDKLFDPQLGSKEMLDLYAEAIEEMEKNAHIPQLFRDIFKNAYLPYRDPATLRMFLKTIGEFEYSHSEKLGDAFEYLLSIMGSQGDAGQFRTPRHIIDFLVEIVDPNMGDTILDPACGTAGFLISAYKYILKKHGGKLTPDQRRKLMRNVVGYDISPDMQRLALVNLYLHGFSDPHIFEYDTLSSEERWDESYDVILANPPFMTPKGGIRPHKRFGVQSNRSEVLFVDYIAEHLNINGRAGIIVPEGIIFQSGKAYKDLRKLLLNDYLYAVVSLPAGVFNPYSGVKTSILLLDSKLAKQTDEVLFVKIDNDGYNLGAQRTAVSGSQLEEAVQLIHAFRKGEAVESAIVHAVERTTIAENGEYNLSGERYRAADHFANSNVEITKLEEIASLEYGYTDTAKNEGDFRFIRITDINEFGKLSSSEPKYIGGTEVPDKYILQNDDILVARTGATYGKTLIWDSGEPAVFASFLIRVNLDKQRILPKYYWAFARSDVYWQQANALVTGGGQPQFNGNALKEVQIPLPTLSVQEEIVAEIEGYQKIIDGARMVVENYRPQITIDPEWEMVELGEVCKIKGGYAFKSADYVEDGAELIRMGNVRRRRFYPENSPKYLPISYVDEYENYVLKKDDIIISMTGTVGKQDYGSVCMIDREGSYLLNQRVGKFEITDDRLSNSFLYYCADQEWFRKMLFANASGGVRQENISNKGIEAVRIPLPPKPVQEEICAKLEEEMKIAASNKQLIDIFEEKIKECIDKVWGK